ncbi:hypothetical protein [Streptomyces violaceusniger]|uniref:hypothetical protein n=1 Tax=Streptomyces violaceusniger TaxID=68280 RepID=UPI0031E495A0
MTLSEETKPLTSLRLRGQRIKARVTVYADEARRRTEAGLGAVDSRSLLTRLYELPVGVPVPLSALDAYSLRALRAAPPGVVDLDEARGLAVRRLAPVARVELVLVEGSGWDQVVRSASQFGPFCARGVVVPEGGPNLDLLLLKARFYGVGVGIAANGAPHGPHWLLEPAPYRPRRHSPAQWLFHEQAWRQLGPEQSLRSRLR